MYEATAISFGWTEADCQQRDRTPVTMRELREFVELVATGNTEIEHLEQRARALLSKPQPEV